MVITTTSSQISLNRFSPTITNIRSYGTTLVELLRIRARVEPDKKAFIFLQNGEIESNELTLTYEELDGQARKIASQLQKLGYSGERALLLYSPGLDFITAFFGCLYAGVIAVPLYPPRRNQNLLRLQSVVADAGATLILTTQSILESLKKHLATIPDLDSLHCLTTDNSNPSCIQAWQAPLLNSNSLAFLQYTSGSTGNPKGVMVSHGNLLHNMQVIQKGFGNTEQTIGMGWLPLFHDMGLIGNVLQPLYLGISCILMSPVDFLQKPLRWLQAISKYGATTSGGPNFAYDLCARKITSEQKADLDLSSWKVAFTGAEPVRAETIEQFSQAFASCGFRREAFYPCYGMAESTLFITGGRPRQAPVIEWLEEEALQENRVITANPEQKGARALVGVGKTWLDQQIKIVDPQSLRECTIGQVGEIWVSGSSVAKGYWNRPEQTRKTFQAYLADTKEGPFLRTGDLGFVREDGELFVTGRLKDVIIIRGRNHYPQDIEQTVEQSHPALIPQRSAAFSVEVEGKEKLVVVVEVERRYHQRRQQRKVIPLNIEKEQRKAVDRRQENYQYSFQSQLSQAPAFDEIINNIKQAIAINHGLQVHAVLLLRVGSIPKTSSGKIQRHACCQGFRDNSLNLIYSSIHDNILRNGIASYRKEVRFC
jgi:acyl-CoA synthetase (AMP-forming)/AMP-acid ligase II